jgi:hypothetical protein
MRALRSRACRIIRTLHRDYLVQQPMTVEGFEGGDREAAHSERKALQGRVWDFGSLQQQDRQVQQPKLAGEKEADRAGSGNYDVVNSRMMLMHERLLCRCPTGAFPQVENHTDERFDAWTASDVRRGDLVREAKDQSFRYRKDLGLPNQVCLFRHGFLTP